MSETTRRYSAIDLPEIAKALIAAESGSALVANLEDLLARCGALPARLYLYDGDSTTFYAGAGLGCTTAAADITLAAAAAARPPRFLIGSLREPVALLDVLAGSGPGGEVGDEVRNPGANGTTRKLPVDWSGNPLIEPLRLICQLLGPSLLAAHRHETASREVRQCHEHIAHLTGAGELLRHLDVDVLLVKILEAAMGAVQAEVGALCTLDAQGRLTTRTTWGLTDVHVDAIRRRDGQRLVDWCLAGRGTICLSAADIAGQLDVARLQARLTGILALPLASGGRAQGVVVLGNPERPFDAARSRLAETVCSMAAIAIDNVLLVKSTVDRERMQKELDLARIVQEAMFPIAALACGPLHVVGASRPCTETGGDYFTYCERDGEMLAVIGDVSGHGLGAALFTTTAHAILQQQIRAGTSIEQAFQILNESLVHGQSGRFMTAAMAVIDRATLVCTYVSAGHNPVLWVHGGTVTWLPSCGMPLGILLDLALPQAPSLQLSPGDYLVLYTDGITEAFDPDGVQFGEARLADLAIAAASERLSPERTMARIFTAVDEWLQGASHADDLTMTIIAVAPA